MESEIKKCKNCEASFTIDSEDFGFYENMAVPPPTHCPQCRLVRRLAVRNERSLYKRVCPKCSKGMISFYAPEAPYTVYCNSCWWKDDWDPAVYAKEYDPGRSFLKQVDELYHSVPLSALHSLHQTLENSEYVNMAGWLKNCYLLFNSDYSENCSYGTEIEHGKECFDNMMMESCELCYDCVNGEKCYECFYSTDLEGCHGVWFSRNLSGCSDCFGCVNLRNKQYYIFNEPYSKEEYDKKIQELGINTREGIEAMYKKVDELAATYPQKYMHERQNRNASGDYVTNSDDVANSFVTTGAQHCRYCLWMVAKPVKDCWDYTQYGDGAERVYDFTLGGQGISDCMFSYYCLNEMARIQYCVKCYNSSDLFGCIGLRQKQYCILNKEYSKEEYEKLKAQIIADMKQRGEYGEFFPISMSPFGYNETTAQELAPLTKEQALAKGYKWREAEEKSHAATKKWNESYGLQDTVLCRAWDEDKESAQQHNCSKAFRITQSELTFYERFHLPLPQKCPNSRHYDRLTRRNPFKLTHQTCQCTQTHPHHDGPCSNEFETAYDPATTIIYCKECYQAEFV